MNHKANPTPENLKEIRSLFENIGGEFYSTPERLAERAQSINAIVFDWDGVFNSGTKGTDSFSTFSEADSMGINLLRFGLWKRTGIVPICAIITGQENPNTKLLARREHFQAVYLGIKDKKVALEHLCKHLDIKPIEVAYFFDDAIDLGVATQVGFRVHVRRKSSPLFTRYVRRNNLAEYTTGAEGGANAIREATEMLLGLMSLHDLVLDSRTAYEGAFAAYVTARKMLNPHFYLGTDDGTELLGIEEVRE